MNEENFDSPRKTDGASSIETRLNSSVKKTKTSKRQSKVSTPNKLTVKTKKTPIDKRLEKNKKHKDTVRLEHFYVKLSDDEQNTLPEFTREVRLKKMRAENEKKFGKKESTQGQSKLSTFFPI